MGPISEGCSGSVPTVWLRIGRSFKRQSSSAKRAKRDTHGLFTAPGRIARSRIRNLLPPPYRIREKISLSGAPPQAEVRKSLWSTAPASTKAIAPGPSLAGNSL